MVVYANNITPLSFNVITRIAESLGLTLEKKWITNELEQKEEDD
jgi:hypothetical protein